MAGSRGGGGGGANAKARRKWLAAFLGGLLAFLLTVRAGLGLFGPPGPWRFDEYGRRRFDAAAWKAAPLSEVRPGYRGRRTRMEMYGDLAERRLLRPGMARAEVRALLGSPTRTRAEQRAGRRYAEGYNLGYGFLDMNAEALWVTYDARGRDPQAHRLVHFARGAL